MKHTPSISKKNRGIQMLFAVSCIFLFASCYDFPDLPERIESDFEFAIPMIDTTVVVGDFVEIKNNPNGTIAEGREIIMGELSYPFYIGDFGEAQDIKWIEPQIVVDTKDLPAGTIAYLKIYLINEDGSKNFFWLEENFAVTATSTPIRVPENPTKITNVATFRTSREVCLDLSLKYPSEVKASAVLRDKVIVKFGVKFGITANFKINL